MTDVQELDLAEYQGKRVIVTRKLSEPNEQGHTAEEIEGFVEMANPMGILLKPRGRVMKELIEASDIERVVVVPEAPKPIRVKGLKEVTHDNVRQHLADRHGYGVAWLKDTTDDQAFKRHEEIDHEELAHYHGDEKPAGAEDGDDDSDESDDND